MNTKVIYTAIFGGYDQLPDPEYIPSGWDFVCFTDSNIQSNIWDVRPTPAIYKDPTRNARKHKVLPHRWFPNYEYSLWVDGNILIRENINELLSYLDNYDIAVHDHNQNADARDCVYKEAEAILNFGRINSQKDPSAGTKAWKDNPKIITKQVNDYYNSGYPPNNSLAVTMQLLRRHNTVECKKFSERWWEEIKYRSKRDQLSFNYTSWVTNVPFVYFKGDSRNTKHFLQMGKHKGKK